MYLYRRLIFGRCWCVVKTITSNSRNMPKGPRTPWPSSSQPPVSAHGATRPNSSLNSSAEAHDPSLSIPSPGPRGGTDEEVGRVARVMRGFCFDLTELGCSACKCVSPNTSVSENLWHPERCDGPGSCTCNADPRTPQYLQSASCLANCLALLRSCGRFLVPPGAEEWSVAFAVSLR